MFEFLSFFILPCSIRQMLLKFFTIISVHYLLFSFHFSVVLHKCSQLFFNFRRGILKVSIRSPRERRFPIHRLHSEGGSNKSKFTQTALTTTSVLN